MLAAVVRTEYICCLLKWGTSVVDSALDVSAAWVVIGTLKCSLCWPAALQCILSAHHFCLHRNSQSGSAEKLGCFQVEKVLKRMWMTSMVITMPSIKAMSGPTWATDWIWTSWFMMTVNALPASRWPYKRTKHHLNCLSWCHQVPKMMHWRLVKAAMFTLQYPCLQLGPPQFPRPQPSNFYGPRSVGLGYCLLFPVPVALTTQGM